MIKGPIFLTLSWVDNAEWIAFVDEFLPAVRSPSRKVLTNQLIPTAVAEFQAAAKVAANSCEVTIQADGWMGVNHHYLIAFMISVAAFLSQFFIAWEIIYIKPPKYLTR